MTAQCLKHTHCHKQHLLQLDPLLIVLVKPCYKGSNIFIYFHSDTNRYFCKLQTHVWMLCNWQITIGFKKLMLIFCTYLVAYSNRHCTNQFKAKLIIFPPKSAPYHIFPIFHKSHRCFSLFKVFQVVSTIQSFNGKKKKMVQNIS